MNRVTFVEIVGRKYPLSFSLAAAKEIINRFGSLEKMESTMASMESVSEDAIDTVTTILEILIKQGCAYLNKFGKDLPKEKGAKYDEEYKSLTKEEIEVGIDVFEVDKAIEAIWLCMNQSGKKEIETESKNAKAPKAD